MYIYGANPIKDLFESKPDKIKKVFLNKKRHQTFANSLEKFHIKVEDFNVNNFKEFRDVNHQEIVASISDPVILDTKQLIEINEDVKNPVILILDQINDPQNFGAIIRNVSAFGGNGIITSIHGSTPLTATAIKTSAGT
jgi:23S rRNA (guanosine2251-2'-O)-methyltransferase